MNVDKHASRESKMDDNFVNNIMVEEGYIPIKKDLSHTLNKRFLQKLFSCTSNFDAFLQVPREKCHLVTGFGPTNSPTGGTLSMILRSIMLERELGISSTIVISNLGAFDSRNIEMAKLDYYTKRFANFVKQLGFRGEIRTHVSLDLHVASSFTAKVLALQDFINNEEATTDLYKKLKIQGGDFPTLVDSNYTIADILLPIFKIRKERVLVCAGIEEHYFPKLANIVLRRMDKSFPDEFSPLGAQVTAMFGRLLTGLNGYPKMSKSIPDSSINLDDSMTSIENKILDCKKTDEVIILQMIQLVSDWSPKEIEEAEMSFKRKGTDWLKTKNKYLKYFLSVKETWDTTDHDHIFSPTELFSSSK